MSERTNRGLPAEALIAVEKRRLGSLPFAIALRCCDIGEARLQDGGTVLTTWGLNLNVESQEWYVHETRFHTIWMGADDGSCELVLGNAHSSDAITQWLRDGLRLGENPAWVPIDTSRS